MTTQYTTILKLALPVQGELSGTWGDVVNDNITSMVEEAVAGRKVIDTWTANSHTLTSADGTTSESRAAILTLTDTGTALTGAGTVVCPAASKIYIVENSTAQVITIKTSGGTGIAVPVGKNMVVFCDGTNVEEGISNIASLSIGGDGATVTGIKDEDDMSSDSATKLATQQSIKAYVDSQVGANNELSEVLANGNTTGGTDISVSTGDDITFADSSKAIFGAGSDLQIYHDGSNSIIHETAAGSLILRGTNLNLQTDANVNYLQAVANGAVTLYHQSGGAAAAKLATTSTGIDVTGTVTATAVNTGAGLAGRNAFSSGDIRVAAPNDMNISLMTVSNTLATIKTDFYGGGSLVPLVLQTGTNTNQLYLDTAGNVGIGTSSPVTLKSSTTLQVNGNAKLGDDNGRGLLSLGDIASTGANAGIWRGAAGAYAGTGNYLNLGGYDGITFTTGNADISSQTERMRIDSSGNVGIGTSSPSTRLTVGAGAGTEEIRVDAGAGWADLTLNSNATNGGHIYFNDGSNAGEIFYYHVSDYMAFNTAATERMRIDSSGNVGIGTSSPAKLLDVAGAIRAINSAGSSAAEIDITSGGTWRFRSNPTTGTNSYGLDIVKGSAGTDVKMSINSSGNVGIGTSNPASLLQLLGSPVATSGALATFRNSDATASNTSFGGVLFNSSPGTDFSIGKANVNAATSLSFRNGNSGASLMELTSAGNLLVGDTSATFNDTAKTVIRPSSDNWVIKPTVCTSFNRTASDGDILEFYRGSSSKVGSIGSVTQGGATNLVLDSTSAVYFDTNIRPKTDNTYDVGSASYRWKDLFLSGNANVGSNLLVGTSSPISAGKVSVQSVGSAPGVVIQAPSDCFQGRTTQASGTSYFGWWVYNGSNVGSITSTGSTTAYNTSSDQRLKDNIADADDAGSKIDAIQVRKFDWKADGSHQDYGMIAQELQTVAPEAVTGDADSDEMMGVDYSKLVPMLVKEIQSLRARVAQLEN